MPCRECGAPLFSEELKDKLCFRHDPRRQREAVSNYAGNVGSQVLFVNYHLANATIGNHEYDVAGQRIRR